MRHIGIHLRLQSTVIDLFHRAQQLKVPIFQAFFVFQSTGRLIFVTPEESAECKALRTTFDALYVHGSYWINLASNSLQHQKALHRELSIARRTGFTHMVLHPGSARGAKNREESIGNIARILNELLIKEHGIKIILENTAHGGMSIGGNWDDFRMIKERLNEPERVFYCIDTAHAHSYGYDIITPHGRDNFLSTVDAAVGFDSIALIHLNNTTDPLGSRLDKHALLDVGSIPIDSLRSFVQDKRIAHIPIIMEPPVITQEDEAKLVAMVTEWCQ